MVKKAKKKPVEVEFIQYKGTKNKKEVFNWTNGKVHDFYKEEMFCQYPLILHMTKMADGKEDEGSLFQLGEYLRGI